MPWSDEAATIVEELLRELPLPVRDVVRRAAEARAEALAQENNTEQVSQEIAVQAFVESTPSDLRERLKRALTYHGIDPEEYGEAFGS